MNAQEEQETEWEVLRSIYEGDDAFKEVDKSRIQYRIDGEKSFVVEIEWPEEYPNVAPNISLDIFYNSHIDEGDRRNVKERLMRVAEESIGMAVTYNLIEFAKDNKEELTANWVIGVKPTAAEESSKPEANKQALSKAAKRKMWDKGGNVEGERPRGHDWIDILKHLSQTKNT